MEDCRIFTKTGLRAGGIAVILATALLVIVFSKLSAFAYPPEPPATPGSWVAPDHVRLDASGVVWGSPAGASTRASGWSEIMTEDFEGAFPGTKWTLYGDPTWGKESYRPHIGTWSGYCAGGGTQAVDPPGPYPPDMSGWMIYGPFDLTEASDAELLFNAWYRSTSGNDKLFSSASTDGSNFYGISRWGNSGGWKSVNFDLTDVHVLGDLTGQSAVWIAFRFSSDGSGTDEGAYVDDITLRSSSYEC
jgi:hypothetical protein